MKFKITGPGGKSYVVNAPEGATREDAFKYFQSQLQEGKIQPDTELSGARHGMTQADQGDQIGTTEPGPFPSLQAREINLSTPSYLPFGKGFWFANAKTPQDAMAIAEKHYGKNNVYWNQGKIILRQPGKPYDIPIAASEASRMAQATPETAGFIAGTMAAPEDVPFALGYRMLGAGLGSATGHAATDVAAKLKGYSTQTPEQILRGAGGQIVPAALTELSGTGLGELLGYGYKGLPATANVKELAKEGFTPQVGAFLKFPILRRDARVLDQMFQRAKGVNIKNAAKMADKFNTFAAEHGDVAANKLVQQIIAHGDIQSAEEGQKLINGAIDRLKSMQKVATSSDDAAQRLISTNLNGIAKKYGENNPALKEQAVSDVRDLYDKFSEASSNRYAKFDEVSGLKAAPTAPLKEAAARIKALNRYGSLPSEVQRILDDPETHITLAQMQRFRTMAREAVDFPGVVPNFGVHDASELLRAANQSFDIVRQGLEHPEALARATDVTEAVRVARAQQAAKALKDADAFYARGIQKFNDFNVNRVVREANKGGFVESENFVNFLAQPGLRGRTVRIMQMLSPTTRKAARRAFYDKLLGESATVDQTGKQIIDGKKLLLQIGKYGDTADSVLGRGTVKDLQELAKASGTLEGKFTVDSLKGNPDAVAYAVKGAKAAKESVDNFLKNNYISALTEGKIPAEKVIDYLAEPHNANRLREAIRFYGADSVQGKALRSGVTKSIGKKIFTVLPDGNVILTGKDFQNALNAYGDEALTQLYGKDATQELHKLARMAFTLSEIDRASAGFAAPSKLAHVFHPFEMRKLAGYISSMLVNKALSSRTLARAYLFGIRQWAANEPLTQGEKIAAQIVMGTLKGHMAQSVFEGEGSPYQYGTSNQIIQGEPDASRNTSGTVLPAP